MLCKYHMLPQQLGTHNALSHKLTMKGPVCMCAVQLTVGYGTRSLMAHIQAVCVVKDVCVCVHVHAVICLNRTMATPPLV